MKQDQTRFERWGQFASDVRTRNQEEDRLELEQLIDEAVKLTVRSEAIPIDPNTLYSRSALLEMGMPRRLVNSLSAATVHRGQYMGSAVLAALNSRAAATQTKNPVSFGTKGKRNANR